MLCGSPGQLKKACERPLHAQWACPAGHFLSSSYDDDSEGAWNRSGAKLQFFGCSRGVHAELRRHKKGPVVVMSDDHGSCAGLSLYLLDDGIFNRGDAVEDSEGPVGVGQKEHVVLRVKIDVAGAGERIGDGGDMAAVGVNGDQFVVLAGGEELMMSAVDG